MDRRTFIKSTGALAAAGSILSSTSRAQASAEIKHIVVCMMENRSFDHLLGWLPNATGRQAGISYADPSGALHSTYRLAPKDYTGCGYNDPDHSYAGGRTEINNGAMNGFLLDTSNDTFCIGYYEEHDLQFVPKFARTFTTCDQYFPSMLGPTFPNRIYQLAGQADRLDDSFSPCSLPTIFDHLKTAGVSHGYYYNNLPFLVLWGIKYLGISNSYSKFLSDCQNGTLPAVSFVDPAFTLLLNTATDMHPESDIRNGDAFLAQTYNAVANSPLWRNTVFIVNFDEWGGFFETVPPPRALSPNNIDPDLVNGKALLGCRVPCIVASPWTVGNPVNPTVNSVLYDHTSVLQMIESVFDVPAMAARETSGDTGNLLNAIDLNSVAQPAPSLPMPAMVTPQKICTSSFLTTGAPGTPQDHDHNSFQKLYNSALMQEWNSHII